MTLGIKLKKDPDGKISVDQCEIGFINISYNPDDNRFYVSTFENETLATFANDKRGFANAVYFARRKFKES